MTPEQRIDAFWAGDRPDRIPYTIYWNEFRHTKDDPAWRPMFDAGLRVTYGVHSWRETRRSVDVVEDSFTENGRAVSRAVMRTPVGEVYALSLEGWRQRYWLHTPEDYHVMKYIVEHVDLEPDYEALSAMQKKVAGHGIVHVSLGPRSPMQRILVDFAGLENFAVHLVEFEDEVMSLYEALLKDFRRRIEITADGPGRYVSVLENFTAETMGPARFARFHVPVYNELFPVLRAAGKIVGTHFDGKLACCKGLIASAPIDLIESLTPPPEGDMPLADCRAAWPDKLLWVNINTAVYNLEPKEITETVLDAVRAAAPDGRRLAFEVSEAIPDNWRSSMPVVLRALEQASS